MHVKVYSIDYHYRFLTSNFMVLFIHLIYQERNTLFFSKRRFEYDIKMSHSGQITLSSLLLRYDEE